MLINIHNSCKVICLCYLNLIHLGLIRQGLADSFSSTYHFSRSTVYLRYFPWLLVKTCFKWFDMIAELSLPFQLPSWMGTNTCSPPARLQHESPVTGGRLERATQRESRCGGHCHLQIPLEIPTLSTQSPHSTKLILFTHSPCFLL